MAWWMLAGCAMVTFFNRYAFFSTRVKFQLSNKAKLFLSYSVYAVLTAIWLPIVLEIDGTGRLTHNGLDFLIGVCLAGGMAFFRVPSLWVVLVSSAVFFSLRFLVFV